MEHTLEITTLTNVKKKTLTPLIIQVDTLKQMTCKIDVFL